MATIEAFLDFSFQQPDAAPPVRASLRRLRECKAAAKGEGVRADRVVACVAAITLQVALLLGLRWAMRPGREVTPADTEPLQAQVLAPPRVQILPSVPTRPQPMPVNHRVAAPRMQTQQARRSEALQAVAVPRPAQPSPPLPDSASSRIRLYGMDGRVLVPSSSTSSSQPRDLLAEPSTTRGLPGSGRPALADFHVNTTSKAKKAADLIAAFTGGGSYDPCPELHQRMVDLNDRRNAEAAEAQYEQACEGR
ncbi:MAG: hypothetical protein JSR34_11470 [Proteobacteria bacterium]|nr:hypothetical protein [Pseudomonadota bacterium]